MRRTIIIALLIFLWYQCNAQLGWQDCYPIPVPRLKTVPVIDGDLSDWKNCAFSDGIWDIDRIRYTPWYDPAMNRLINNANESSHEDDLSARYYIAWDNEYLYFGAEVHDNYNDVSDPQHEPKRWYFKDAVCWFIEAPFQGKSKKFGQGDNAFCFVIDTLKPSYGAWWRHGNAERNYIEEPLPMDSADYSIRMNPWRKSPGDFILEARLQMSSTLARSNPDWKSPKEGDEYGLEIVQTDPDGGDYGGHFLIYGKGDDDATWGKMKLVGPLKPSVW